MKYTSRKQYWFETLPERYLVFENGGGETGAEPCFARSIHRFISPAVRAARWAKKGDDQEFGVWDRAAGDWARNLPVDVAQTKNSRCPVCGEKYNTIKPGGESLKYQHLEPNPDWQNDPGAKPNRVRICEITRIDDPGSYPWKNTADGQLILLTK